MGAPVVLTALAITGLEAWRTWRPDARSASTATSLAEAIAGDDVNRAYDLVRAGESPSAPILVRHEKLTGGRSLRVAPLIWAVATNAPRTLQMLLGFGALADAKTIRQAHCLAQQLGHTRLVGSLEQHQAPHAKGAPCPRPGDGMTPLEAVASSD